MPSFHSTYLSYHDTGAFSPIVLDYLSGKKALREFYQHIPDLDGIKAAMEARKLYSCNRALLVDELNKQYDAVQTTDSVRANIQSLLSEDTFTVCTAHQPNIFTGHLYFIYKIVHAVRLAEELNGQIPGSHFVPVYYMGSEDADLEELGEVQINGKKYVWETGQKGAVGRMKIDTAFIRLIEGIEGQLSVESYGKEVAGMIRSVYTPGKTIEEATFELVNHLFMDYGLLVLLPDNPRLKKAFSPVVKKELTTQFSQPVVSSTIAAFPPEYKVQAAGRSINLFYLKDDLRERIEPAGSGFVVANSDIHFRKEEMLAEIEEYPERFSPNVILRPVFQEMVLPDVAFIGGGGELAYWLELKKVFEAMQVPYPVLILRNSFMVIDAETSVLMHKLDLTDADIFNPVEYLHTRLVKKSTNVSLDLGKEIAELSAIYWKIKKASTAIDSTLSGHVTALETESVKRLGLLQKKMLRAEKRKFEAALRQVQKVKHRLFPGNILQERTDNLLPCQAKWGKAFIQAIYDHSKGLDMAFCVISED